MTFYKILGDCVFKEVLALELGLGGKTTVLDLPTLAVIHPHQMTCPSGQYTLLIFASWRCFPVCAPLSADPGLPSAGRGTSHTEQLPSLLRSCPDARQASCAVFSLLSIDFPRSLRPLAHSSLQCGLLHSAGHTAGTR